MRHVVFGLLLVSFAAASAHAQSCPGHPDAIGTSRVLPISFGEYTRLGRLQYPQTLPLADKEVVIIFDDGPRPMFSDRVLDILASQCVKVIISSSARRRSNGAIETFGRRFVARL